MIALPPCGVATDSVLATASPPAAVISRTTSSAGAASPPSPANPPPESLTTTFAPCAASNRAYERPSPLPPPVMAATRSSNLRSLFSEDKAIQITPGTPFLQQVVECVEARHVRFADSGTNAFSSSAALIVVIARRAGDCEFGSVYGGFADRVDPVVLLIAGAIRNNDVLIPFGSVDPWHERRAVHRVHELVRDYGVKGFKFHPSMQAFEPNDRRFYPIYEAITEARVPALFHTGQTGMGAGLPGGHRIKLRYSDPMLLDDVAADFPELTIVMAHPAVPWVDSQIAIATHKSNVYIDLSGWSPRYFPPQLVRAASRQLRTKVLFGTDYPYIRMDRWRRDFEGLDIDPAVVPLIYKDNALRVLGVIK